MMFLRAFLITVLALCFLESWVCSSQSTTVPLVSPSPNVSINGTGQATVSAVVQSTVDIRGQGQQGQGNDSIVISPSMTVNMSRNQTVGAQNSSSGTPTTGPSTGQTTGQLIRTLDPAEQQINTRIDSAIAKVKLESPVPTEPRKSMDKDKIFISEIEKFFETAETLEKEYETLLNKTLDIVKVDTFAAVQMKKFNCLTERVNEFPKRSDPPQAKSHLGSNSISQSFDCPRIVQNHTSPARHSRRRRDVEITMEFEWHHEEDDVPEEYAHMYRYLRKRRSAEVENNRTNCRPLPCDTTRILIMLKLMSMNFTDNLGNEQSDEYKSLKDKINSTLAADMSASNLTWTYNLFQCKFRSGSIVAEIYADVSNYVTIASVLSYFQSITSGGSFGNFTMDRNASSVVNVTVKDGAWSEWGDWPDKSNCDELTYQVTRTRTCNNPAPTHGGKSCPGQRKETKKCDCDDTLKNIGGNITSPFYPRNYPFDVTCTWTLYVPVNHTVELDLADFHLEKDKKCFYDYVKILDGNSTHAPELLPRSCGTQVRNRKFTSTGEAMTFIFHSDRDVNFKGFTAQWKKVLKAYQATKPTDQEYVPQEVTVTNLISCPSFNNTAIPPGRGTTCPSYSLEAECIFDNPVYVISCFIATRMNRNLPQTGDNTTKVTFQHIMHKDLFPTYYSGNKYCVTWNKTATRGSIDGGWTRRGCSAVRSNLTHTTCACDHTGIFAVVASKKIVFRKFKLLANTYTAVGVSFTILLLAILHIVWKVDIHGGEVMRMNICLAIIVMQCMFLIGANVKAEQTLCGFLAFGIYFSVLAEFCWLLLHGLRIHGKIKEIFASGLNIDVVYVCIGWGLPLLLSMIAIGIQIDLKNPEDVCWTAAAGGAMWGYSAPLLVIVLCNIAVLITLLIPTKERTAKYDYHKMKFRVFKDAIFLALFGITCVMAYQTVARESFKAQYYLTVSVVLQAVAMFVFGREGQRDFVKRDDRTEGETVSQNTNEEDLPEKTEEEITQDKQEIKKVKKRKQANHPQEKIKVATLKNLNIYKEEGHFVIEA